MRPHVAALIGAAIAANAAAQVCSPSVIATFPTDDQSQAVAHASGFAYVAQGFAGLEVLDVSDPANPVSIATLPTPHRTRDIVLDRDLAYVACDQAGLLVVDIADPRNPQIIGSADTPGVADGVAIEGTHAYLIDTKTNTDPGVLHVIDIADPTDPSIVGSAQMPGETRGVDVSNGFVYIADGFSGVEVVNAGVPDLPFIAHNVPTPDHALDVTIAGNLAYVADRNSGLQILDISIPTNAHIIGHVKTNEYARTLTIRDDLAYLFISRPTQGTAEFDVIDVSDPTNPAILGIVDLPTVGTGVAATGGIADSGNHAYVMDLEAGLQIIDVSPCRLPRFIDGAILASGSSSTDNDSDNAFALGIVDAHKASGGGITSSGFDDEFAEAEVDLDAEITFDGNAFVITLTANGSAFATSVDGFATASVSISTSDEDFNDAPLRFLVEDTLFFDIETSADGASISFLHDDGSQVTGDSLEPGIYRLSANLNVNVFVDGGGDDDDSAFLTWTITLTQGPPCGADYNADGNVNVLDFVAFQQGWLAHEPAADCDGNGTYNVVDFVCFQGVFAAGC